MEEKKTAKEFWVQLAYHENDDYNELWRTEDNRYVARHTYEREGVWYSVIDPMGYCELRSPLPEHFVFHVCNSRFEELHVSSNGDGKEFPCLRVLCQDEWAKLRKTLSCEEDHAISSASSMELKTWLLSFKDPEVYGEVARDYDENWCGLVTTLQEEVLSSFQYAGETYQITKIKQQHTVCKVEWHQYYVAGQHTGAKFDAANIGTMYSESAAVDKTTDALNEIYGCTSYTSRLSYITTHDGEHYEHNCSIYGAAKHLIDSNYHRDYVDSVIEHERHRHSFFASRENVLAQFPQYIRDCPAI